MNSPRRRKSTPQWVIDRLRKSHKTANEAKRAETERRRTAEAWAQEIYACDKLLKDALAAHDPLLLEGLALGAEVSVIRYSQRPLPDFSDSPKLAFNCLSLADVPPEAQAIRLEEVPSPLKGLEKVTRDGFANRAHRDAPLQKPSEAEASAPSGDTDRTSSTKIRERLEKSVLVDIELLRVSIARDEFSEMRLWSYARAFDDGSGRVNKAGLWAYVHDLGIIGSKRTFDHILKQGRDLYWQIYTGKESVFISLTGWRRLAESLTARELAEQAERVESDQPGARRVYLDLSGDLQEAQARVYAAWMAQRTAKHGFMRISRARLQQLWGRSTRQLIRWEKALGIQSEACYAEHEDIYNPLVPGHAYLCLAEDGKTVFASWRTSNRYTTPPANFEEHPHSGQRRKVRAAVNRLIDASEPVYFNADGRKTGRIHFFDHQRGRRWHFGYKVLNRHLKKHGDVFDRQHYVHIGKRYGKHIEEMSSGDVFRHRGDRRDFEGEQSPDFQARAAFFRQGWSDRNA